MCIRRGAPVSEALASYLARDERTRDRSGKLFGTATAAGTARLLDNASEQQAADAALNAKYAFEKPMMSFVSKLRGSELAYIEIVLA